jgi:hypothetical protein
MLRGKTMPHIWCPDRFEMGLTDLQTNKQTWQDPEHMLSVILKCPDLPEHTNHAPTIHSYLQWLCPPLPANTKAQYRNELCAGQQSSPIYKPQSGRRRGAPCVTSGAGNPGRSNEHLREGQVERKTSSVVTKLAHEGGSRGAQGLWGPAASLTHAHTHAQRSVCTHNCTKIPQVVCCSNRMGTEW